jgi:hypothetical protein
MKISKKLILLLLTYTLVTPLTYKIKTDNTTADSSLNFPLADNSQISIHNFFKFFSKINMTLFASSFTNQVLNLTLIFVSPSSNYVLNLTDYIDHMEKGKFGPLEIYDVSQQYVNLNLFS